MAAAITRPLAPLGEQAVLDLLRGRPAQSIVVGFRSAPESSAVDPLLKDDLAIRLQTRLQRDGIPMMVLSVPLDT